MKALLTAIIFLFCGKAFSQLTPVTPTSYGNNNLRGSFWNQLQLPTRCGVPGNIINYSVDSSKAMIQFDSCGHTWYGYDPSTNSWTAFSTATGSSGNADSLQHVIGTSYIQFGGTGITTGSTSYSVPAGTMIDKIMMYDPALTYVSIGTSVNGWQISPRFTISAATFSTIQLSRYFVSTTTIYFNGVTSNTIIKIYKL